MSRSVMTFQTRTMFIYFVFRSLQKHSRFSYSVYCLFSSMVGKKGVAVHGASDISECPISSLSCQIFLLFEGFSIKKDVMRKIRENAAGIDIGAKDIFVSVEGQEVRKYPTFTEDLQQAANYLLSHGIETVAMEATGVYWVILYEILEQSGFDVWLVDGRQTKQVPGRKTDVKDCAWIRELHSYGLLNRCFVPDENVKETRHYVRLREDHIRSASMHVNHMQKALTLMNIRLKEVLSQIHGKSGLAMIEAILSGERDPIKLLALCDSRLRKTKSDLILKSLNGHYTKAGLFALRQAYEGYQFYKAQIASCDQQLQQVMESINDFDEEESNDQITRVVKRKAIRHNKPDVDHLGGHMLKIFSGNDVTELPGITDYTWLQLYAEVGADLKQWDSEKHFTSWLGLAPGQHQSGKKSKNRNKKYRPKAGQIFRQIAMSLLESKKIGLGAFGRRIKAKRGPAIAIKATARKLAELYWRRIVKGISFVERGIKDYEEKVLKQKQKWVLKTAKELGYQLQPETQP